MLLNELVRVFWPRTFSFMLSILVHIIKAFIIRDHLSIKSVKLFLKAEQLILFLHSVSLFANVVIIVRTYSYLFFLLLKITIILILNYVNFIKCRWLFLQAFLLFIINFWIIYLSFFSCIHSSFCFFCIFIRLIANFFLITHVVYRYSFLFFLIMLMFIVIIKFESLLNR